MRSLLITIAALAAVIASDAKAQKLGQEFEVDEGYYLTLVAEVSGWRIWRTETRDRISCKAIKSPLGQPHPRPSGDQDMFYGGTPFVQISRGFRDKASVDVRGQFGYHGQWRQAGARFWEEKLEYVDLALNDGRKIEINSVTYEYHAVRVGRVEESGVLDLKGFSTAMASLAECDPEIDFPQKPDPSKPMPLEIASGYDVERKLGLPYGLEGRARYRATISAAGKVTNCELVETSGDQRLDDATCPLVAMSRFRPASTSDGQPIEGVFEGNIFWGF